MLPSVALTGRCMWLSQGRCEESKAKEAVSALPVLPPVQASSLIAGLAVAPVLFPSFSHKH